MHGKAKGDTSYFQGRKTSRLKCLSGALGVPEGSHPMQEILYMQTSVRATCGDHSPYPRAVLIFSFQTSNQTRASSFAMEGHELGNQIVQGRNIS